DQAASSEGWFLRSDALRGDVRMERLRGMSTNRRPAKARSALLAALFAGGGGFALLLSRCSTRNGDIERRHGTKRGEGPVEIGGFPDHKDREPVLVNVATRHPRHVWLSHLFDPGAIALEEVRGVAVELVRHALHHDLLFR